MIARSNKPLVAVILAIGGFALISAGGCSPNSGDSNSQIIKAPKAPRQDTDLARKTTAHALDLIAQSKWSDAESALLAAIDEDLTYGPAHNNLGTVYLHENKLYQSAWEFQYAARLMPYQPEPKSNLGLVFEEAGKLDDAADAYDQAIKIEPDNPQYVGNAARVRVRRGDKDAKVRELLTKVVSNDTRPDWVSWAREKLVLLGPLPTTSPED
jgi:Flp pilus assembly protein TadD